MQEMTAGQVMLSEFLPPDVYTPGQTLDKKGIAQLMGDIARKHPERYEELSYKLIRLGLKTGESTGGASFSLKDLSPARVAVARAKRVRHELGKLHDQYQGKEREEKVVAYLQSESEKQTREILEESVADGNKFALQLNGAGRGNPGALASMRGGNVLVADATGRPVPIPITRGYSQGVSPLQYLALSYGARKGMVTTKIGVGSGGFLSKLIQQAGHRLAVVEDEDKAPMGRMRGLPVDVGDASNIGALLASDHGEYPRNTVITPKLQAILQKQGYDEILVRSPIASSHLGGGVYAKDVGIRETGRFASIGDHVGQTASQAIGEQVAQTALCLAVGTRVRMADNSVKAIEDIQEGDWVLGADKHGRVFPTRVLAVYTNGHRECHRTVFRCPHQKLDLDVVSTLDHKFLGTRLASGCDGEPEHYELTVAPLGRLGGRVYAALPTSFTWSAAEEPAASGKSVGLSQALFSWLGDLTSALWEGLRAAFTGDLFRRSLSAPSFAKRSFQYPVGRLPTYDIEVDHQDHLFVLENGLIVSNSAKHQGGRIGGKDDTPGLQGFDLADKLTNLSINNRGFSTHAEQDGRITAIKEAPQGGWNIFVGEEAHYVAPEFKPIVKVGSVIEAGDQLTNGVPNPAKVIQHKGIGEGRRAFVEALRTGLAQAGNTVDRRQLELVATGLVDRVEIDDEFDEFSAGEVVPYSRVERLYKARQDSEESPISRSEGKYLEEPVLHYSIGTRVTPSVRKRFEKMKVDKVRVHAKPPPFKPKVVRAIDLLQTDPDWMTRFLGSGLQKGLQNAVTFGSESNEDSTSFVPSRAKAINFGKLPLHQGLSQSE